MRDAAQRFALMQSIGLHERLRVQIRPPSVVFHMRANAPTTPGFGSILDNECFNAVGSLHAVKGRFLSI